MSYASLANLSKTLTALSVPVDYGSGVQWSSGLLLAYPNASLQLGLWMVGLIDSVNSGKLDKDIIALGNYLSRLQRPVFLRLGYEFDSPSNHYHPSSYRKAFKRIVTKFQDLGVTNVAFVWHATGVEPRDGLTIDSWFPGEEYVDWCGISFFQQPFSCQIPTKCSFSDAESVISFCRQYSLPIMIAESTPFGGILDDPVSDPDAVNEAGYSGSTWNSWFIPIIEFIEKHDLKMWNYINCDWDSQAMWQKERAPEVHWGDTRIEMFPGVREKWHHDVLDNERYSWILAKSSPDADREDIKDPTGDRNETVEAGVAYPVCEVISTKEVIRPTQRRAIDLFISAMVLVSLSCLIYFYFQHRKQTSHEYVIIR
jgi:hypothetical protein